MTYSPPVSRRCPAVLFLRRYPGGPCHVPGGRTHVFCPCEHARSPVLHRCRPPHRGSTIFSGAGHPSPAAGTWAENQSVDAAAFHSPRRGYRPSWLVALWQFGRSVGQRRVNRRTSAKLTHAVARPRTSTVTRNFHPDQ